MRRNMIQSLQRRAGVPGQFGLNSTKWRCVFSAVLNKLTVSRACMCTGSWFHALGPATANVRVPKCVTEEQTTRSPRVADRSLCLLPTVVTGRQTVERWEGSCSPHCRIQLTHCCA